MKSWFVLLIGLVVLSCNNERVIQLPEIENTEINLLQSFSATQNIHFSRKAVFQFIQSFSLSDRRGARLLP